MKTPSAPPPVCKQRASSYAWRRTSANQFAATVYEAVVSMSTDAHDMQVCPYLLYTNDRGANIELDVCFTYRCLERRGNGRQEVLEQLRDSFTLL